MNRSKYWFSAPHQNAQGSTLVEIAIVAGLLVIVGFGAFRIDYSISNRQVVAQISREAANSTLRNCAESQNPQPCLDRVIETIQIGAVKALPDLTVIASIYECPIDHYECTGTCTALGPPGATCNCRCLSPIYQSATTKWGPLASASSKYTSTTLPPDVLNLIDRFRFVAIGEVYFDESIFNKQGHYEATIY